MQSHFASWPLPQQYTRVARGGWIVIMFSTGCHFEINILLLHRGRKIIFMLWVPTLSLIFAFTGRSAVVEPPGLGSKCGKWVERLCDF